MPGPLVPEEQLRAAVRHLIDHGQLPVMRARDLHGGYGLGDRCSVCRLEITSSQVDYEVGVEGPQPLHFHIMCFSAWQLECAARLHALGGPNDLGSDNNVDNAGDAEPQDDTHSARFLACLERVSHYQSRPSNASASKSGLRPTGWTLLDIGLQLPAMERALKGAC
jgi:hypothetical protein